MKGNLRSDKLDELASLALGENAAHKSIRVLPELKRGTPAAHDSVNDRMCKRPSRASVPQHTTQQCLWLKPPPASKQQRGGVSGCVPATNTPPRAMPLASEIQ